MPGIPSTDEGITGVKTPYQDALLDTFKELMKAAKDELDKEYTDTHGNGRITGKEYATTYLGMMQYAMTIAAQLSKDSAEAQYKVDNILALDKEIKQEQIRQLKAETAFKDAQMEQVQQSVWDNRQIKILDSLAQMNGMILNGGSQSIPAGMLDQLLAAINAVKVIPRSSMPTIAIDANITADNIITAAESAADIAVTGTVGIYANVGDPIILYSNSKTFNGSVAADRTFSILVPGTDIYADLDHIVEVKLLSSDTIGNVKVAIATHAYTVTL